ncbi:Hint domain-containing protein [Frankia sp. EAN1pec]|uniref:polymorphic toxin-type HINT domain-containing protein n=1 Tax=Parafrankia sp. (strain EAN1pec) TaxID=298653 RepID=UPI00030EEBC8
MYIGVGAGIAAIAGVTVLTDGLIAAPEGAAAGGLGRAVRGCTGRNSFDGATGVLMADGTHKPIRDVHVGDQVLATDPTTGRTEPHTVTNLIIGTGDKHLVDITLDTPGPDATLTATDHHPFWDETDHTWVDADDLTTTNRLRTPTGTLLAVVACGVPEVGLSL